MDKVVFVGAGGHCKVLLDIFQEMQKSDFNNIEVFGITDYDQEKIGKAFCSSKVIGNDSVLPKIFNDGVRYAVVGIGGIGDNSLRKDIYIKLKHIGFNILNIIHPSSYIGSNVSLGDGNVVGIRSIINAEAQIGSNVIINTGSIIEHDCVIESHVHIAPGVVMSGGVHVDDEVHIGTGAVIIQGIKIGKNALVGAGSVVINDVPEGAVVVGNPAKIIHTNN